MGCGASTAAPGATKDAKPEASRAKWAARLTEVFKAMDKDGNGTVDLKEFLATAKAGDDTMELTMMFHFMDGSLGDTATEDKLTLDEWLKGIETLKPSDEALEKQLNDIMKILQPLSTTPDEPVDRKAMLEQIFRQTDVSGDGKLQISEFKALAGTNKAAMSMQEAVFGMVDENSDGVLSMDEFVTFNMDMGAKLSDADFTKQAQQWAVIAAEVRKAAAEAPAPPPNKAAKKPLKAWSEEEVKDVLSVFAQFDKDSDGKIDEAELAELGAALMIDTAMAEADTLVKDGVVDLQEFFIFYTECSKEEAEKAFADHANLFAAPPAAPTGDVEPAAPAAEPEAAEEPPAPAEPEAAAE